MSLLLKVACPECGQPHDSASLGAELRCTRCGRDFRAAGDGDNASRVLSVTPDELNDVPYSQRSIEVPVNKVSSIIVADPALLSDKLLRDTPLKDNTRWVGKVRLLKKLGQGGMGAVYRGYDEDLALDVAVKILPLPMGERDAQFVARFRQEARISAQINHPNVVRTLHVDEQGDVIYLVMDYIPGTTARGLVDAKGQLAIPLALQIIQDAARGVQAAHERGVIHRDIKPDNILVADDGRVLLSDLGLAKAVGSGPAAAVRMPVTRMGLLLGTPHYMSPEQWNIGASCGPSTDIWSLGATLWMLLTRMPPFDDKDTGVLAQQIKEQPLADIREIRKEIPASVVDVLNYCMAKKPEDRFQNCAALIAAIDWVLNDFSASNGNGCLPRPGPFPSPAGNANRPAGASAPVSDAQALLVNAPASTNRPALETTSVAAVQSATEPRRAPAWATPTQPAAPAPSPAPQKSHDIPAAPPLWQPVPPKPRSRRSWLIAASIAAVFSLICWRVFTGSGSFAAIPVELHYPAHVNPGDMAELSADVNGGRTAEYSVLWLADDRSIPGERIQIPLEHDTEFTIVVRQKSSGVELTRRTAKIEVELVAKAADGGLVSAESGQDVKLTGSFRGGAVDTEVRWIDADKPETTVASGPNFTVPAANAAPGRRNLVFQARRKNSAWKDGSSGRVTLEIAQRVPAEFTALVNESSKAQADGIAAETGIEAAASWRKAVELLEQAKKIFPNGNIDGSLRACREHLDLEQKYLVLVAEARKLKVTAEQLPPGDIVGRLSAWSDACRPYTTAVALFDRAEVRFESASAQAQVEQLKTDLKVAEQTRSAYESAVSKARRTANEGKKYLSPAVALPFWEDAMTQFAELRRKYPKRTDEFAIDMRDIEENRDKAYLQVVLGAIPQNPRDRERRSTPPPPASQAAPVTQQSSMPQPSPTPPPIKEPAPEPASPVAPKSSLIPQPQIEAPKSTPPVQPKSSVKSSKNDKNSSSK